MNVLALNCTNCGAPLEFSARAVHVRCRYCDSLMLVKRSAGAARLDLIERGKALPPVIPADTQTSALKDQLRDLDEEWTRQRDGLLKSLDHRQFRMIGRGDFATLAAIAIIVLATCIAAMVFAGMNGFILMTVFGVIPVALFIARGGLNVFDSAGYIRKALAYTRRRSRLVDQIHGRIAVHGIDAEEVDLAPLGHSQDRKD